LNGVVEKQKKIHHKHKISILELPEKSNMQGSPVKKPD